MTALGQKYEPRTGLRASSKEEMNELFMSVGQKLREGLSDDAEAILTKAIAARRNTIDNLAHLKRLLSFTLETAGRYKESLGAVREYEDEAKIAKLAVETQIRVATQLAIAHNNTGDQPRAITLLKDTRELAEQNNLTHLFGAVDIGLARVYRKLAEYPICRDFAQSALDSFRTNGNWLGMAEAYREIANSYNQEGNSEKSLDSFDQGIKIIGRNSAPFMLGKLYTDLSGAYWFLRRPKEGVACLEKSIDFFDQTSHSLNSVMAYNNLGINLILIGDWAKAEQMIRRALAIAEEENSVHVAGVFDSLGELEMLRENFEIAEEHLDKSIACAEKEKHAWYTVQSMRSLARCYLAENKPNKAAAKAKETIEKCELVGNKHYAIMAGLVLAEARLRLGMPDECETALIAIEESDPSSDFFVLGNIQRIRGLAALADNDNELALHHFNRGLTLFESANDLYHTGLMNYLLGAHLETHNAARAKRCLSAAADIFRKLAVPSLLAAVSEASEKLALLPDVPEAPRRVNSVVSQLLTVRLAEATASRELLFRELVAVLHQESNAKRILIAEPNGQKQLLAFITHGYTPQESSDLVGKLDAALANDSEKAFAKAKNIALFPLRGTAALPAYLLAAPSGGALLNDGSSFTPLLRVVELGMDVIALREREKTQPLEADSRLEQSLSVMPGFIHSSPAMTVLVEEINKIRSSDVTVLVTGESGTGKELVSRAIHIVSNRKDEVFVPFNCTAVPKDLTEGHLFGYKKGAFTGAVQDSTGVIRTADGGTLFLDEVGDLSLDVQPKLLRFLQEGEIQTLGDKKPTQVDVRIIAATNMHLEEKVANGTFREDLYYRLNVIRLRVPPLRERRSEIPPLVNHYINHYSNRFSKRNITFTPHTIDLLMVSDWVGNVRQLANEVQAIIARAVDNEVITPEHLSPELRRSSRPLMPFSDNAAPKPIMTYDEMISPFVDLPEGGTLEDSVTDLEMKLIRASLARHRWNISHVAAELGITRRGLYLKLARYGIEKAA